MTTTKKQVRERFRTAVFRRDRNRCRVCGRQDAPLDAHHVQNRNLMPNGGYVAENGISLCPECHELAELSLQGGEAPEKYHQDALYQIIGSSLEQARLASERLK